MSTGHSARPCTYCSQRTPSRTQKPLVSYWNGRDSLKRQNKTLFIIPCCKGKAPGGQTPFSLSDPLQDLISQPSYRALLSARKLVLDELRGDPKYVSGKYDKNSNIKDGPEFGTSRPVGEYLPAVERYVGKLYKGSPGLADRIKTHIADPNKPCVLILSALYGPLHPLALIQDYNLQMSDRPAYQAWKQNLPPFLAEYVRRSSIDEIRLYLGGSTHYLRVAKPAVKLLKEKKLVDRVIHYDVKNGNSHLTPTLHGRLALSHLEGRRDPEAEAGVVTTEL